MDVVVVVVFGEGVDGWLGEKTSEGELNEEFSNRTRVM